MVVYALTGPDLAGVTIKGGVRNAIAHAPSIAVAERVASYDSRIASRTYFEDATAGAAAVQAATNWAGWTMQIQVVDTDGSITVDVSSVAASTIDVLAAAMVTALNATTPISNASYNSTTQLLTVAAIADALGDQRLFVNMYPPGKTTAVNNMLGAIVNSGIVGAVLTIALPADAYAVPAVIAKFKGV